MSYQQRTIGEICSELLEEAIRIGCMAGELKQLQLQINPLFLFNSLYLVYRMARADGHAALAALSLNLSKYDRYITQTPQQIVALEDESTM
ncbi:MAG: histidine kinase [Aristaeellaceae bacterium]